MSDGGGKVLAAARPLAGSGCVGRFLIAVSKSAGWSGLEITELNGQPALLVFGNHVLANAFLFDATAQGVTAIYVVRNPDKLRRLGDHN